MSAKKKTSSRIHIYRHWSKYGMMFCFQYSSGVLTFSWLKTNRSFYAKLHAQIK